MILAFLAGLVWWEWFFILSFCGCWWMSSDYDDRFPLMPIVLVGVGVAIWFAMTDTPTADLKRSLHMIPYWVGSYLGLGVVWSFFKWTRLLLWLKRKMAEQLITTRQEVLKRFTDKRNDSHYGQGVDQAQAVRQETRSYWNNWMYADDIKDDGTVTISVKHRKNLSRVTTWILYWPFSLMNYVFGKLLKELLDRLVDCFRWMYKAISEAVFKDFKIS
jgi:hypothetical protein